MEIRDILEGIRQGTLSVEEGEAWFLEKKEEKTYREMGYAKLDTGRKARSGFAEVVFCGGKPDAYLAAIGRRGLRHAGDGASVRAGAGSPSRCDIRSDLPHSQNRKEGQRTHRPRGGVYGGHVGHSRGGGSGADGGIFRHPCGPRLRRGRGGPAIITAANCVIAVAGMEGALASVIGGLVRNPVIAVPTSVGYGASFHGLSALLTMLNSCANGITTVNIDNGFGAGYVATQINRLAERGHI